MKILEIRSSLYPNSVIKIPIGISRSALDRVLNLLGLLRDDYRFRGMKQGVRLFFGLLLGVSLLACSFWIGYDRGVDSGYRVALLDVYRGYNVQAPVTIAGAGGHGRVIGFVEKQWQED